MKVHAKSLFTAALIAGTVIWFSVRLIAPALPPFVGPPDYEEFRQFNLPQAKHLVVDNADGTVRVRTHDSPDASMVNIHAEIRLYGRKATNDAALADYATELVQATHQNGILEIVTEPQARPAGIDLSVAYEIRVPKGTDVDVIGSNGNVWVEEGCGRVAVYGGNSDIEITEPRGIVIAKSDNGRIKLVEARDDATLEAVNGSIYADMADGVLDAATVNGHIVVRVLSETVDACDLESENGSVTVELASNAFSYDARTGRGFIRSDFALAEDQPPGVLDAKRIQGSVGRGGPLLTVDALNGNIWFKRKS